MLFWTTVAPLFRVFVASPGCCFFELGMMMEMDQTTALLENEPAVVPSGGSWGASDESPPNLIFNFYVSRP